MKSFEPTEVFLGFYRTHGTNAESLVSLIKDVLKNCDLNIQNIRGQCYAMRGSYTGLQARIKNVNNICALLCTYFKFMFN